MFTVFWKICGGGGGEGKLWVVEDKQEMGWPRSPRRRPGKVEEIALEVADLSVCFHKPT